VQPHHRETRESAAFSTNVRTHLHLQPCPAVLRASDCPIGLLGDRLVGLVQGRACGDVSRREGSTCKRSRTRSLRQTRSCRCTDACLLNYNQPLRIGGDSDGSYMIRCTFPKQYFQSAPVIRVKLLEESSSLSFAHSAASKTFRRSLCAGTCGWR
jgi:hypothetical protein